MITITCLIGVCALCFWPLALLLRLFLLASSFPLLSL